MYLSVLGTHAGISGTVQVPNSKYHAHRALILASLASGSSRISGLTDARHVQYTVAMLRQLGTGIEIEGDTFVVHGGAYRPQRDTVSAGSSGTTLYFMVGLAALAGRDVTVTGQKYFQRRPIGALLAALRDMGLDVSSTNDCPPIRVRSGRPHGGEVHIPGTLSQWVSGLLLLAPFARTETTVFVDGAQNESSYIELTIAMMRQFGLQVDADPDFRRFRIPPNQQAVPANLRMPPDIGSAAFGVAAAALHPADITLAGLSSASSSGSDHPEADFLDLARSMGVPLELDPAAGAVRIRHGGLRLQPVEVDCRRVPDMLPILSVMACFTGGRSVFHHVDHVRMKESDRVAAMLQLNAMGADLSVEGSSLVIRGVRGLNGSDLSSFNDHRVLMSLAVAASAAEGRSTLTYPNAYRISYPEYLAAMTAFGLRMEVQDGVIRRARLARPARTARGSSARTIATPAAVEAAAAVTGPDWVRRWAAERPSETAVVDGGAKGSGHLTWSELDTAADRTAAALLELGVQPGDRVAFQLPNCSEFVILTVASLRIGAVAAPLMPIFREREVALALQRAHARVFVTLQEFRGRRPAAELAGLVGQPAPAGPEPGLPVRDVLVLRAPGSADPLPKVHGGPRFSDWHQTLAQARPDPGTLSRYSPTARDAAQLLFTSGTSGEPKGVVHRHGTLSRAAAMEAAHLRLTSDDAVFIPSPLAHQTGFLYGMWLSFVLGCPQILQPVWDAGRALQLMHGWRATFVQAATPFLTDLVQAVDAGATAPPSLRIFVSTGAAVPRYLAERATRVLGAGICGAFGTTETCLGTLAAPQDEPAKVWGTDGRPLAGVRTRIVDDDGRLLPAGVEGNFELSSPTVFDGYLDRPDLTKEVFTEDGWYRTGDTAVMDSAGYLRVTGRVRDIINRGGEKIPVAEIEQLLFRHPSVLDIALAAMPDARLGERACAFVVPVPGAPLSLADLTVFLDRHQVSKHYWPERLELMDAIPRNAVGKVQKFLLRDMARNFAPAGGNGRDPSVSG
ncbi:3-phosphoshikimate 1-carboxyvinyltransferase [Arthrobacter sp. zg-Y20]|uniref:3-phosphoshikimate 1-carboxyvinyltransferase n=1 Tax=unclassified Arthrobacter TaxID=235627 RepID=UPI001D14D2C0|nr:MULTISPECIES: 3-phosphoshikimate 1-carboxyvinyltransferase [unclassified Arthrobacter]MCC3276082.1 3-phosphoshikimate 1-carboxyvinyltransferase [Arthrobacter sp. zg-Y20]MDK1316240.1 3-phosphoshikimate 1-carboxyvinyltransferase [Arthrobacter sp. zg.Y20]WIB05481.1 3-phosphoshikimate 1-carboxyvinyltransferase [Arthrobacter sp. zg-Y20]